MKVTILKESGYDEAALGFSLSYNSTIERAKELFPLFAHKDTGENKFLESMCVWLDITAPRYWWQEFDTYRVGVTKQSESTMHTLLKKELTDDMFEDVLPIDMMEILRDEVEWYKDKEGGLFIVKNMLPEGFLQRRVVCTNYKTLRHIYWQRKNHKLDQWKYFCSELMKQLEHANFIDYSFSVWLLKEDNNESST